MTVSWITGAGGFIGTHLARALSAAGREVGGFSRQADTPGTGFLAGPIDAERLDLLAAQTGIPDEIYHLAGGSSVGASFADPALDFERTVTTSTKLLDWTRERAPDAAIVMASSAAVYGANHPGPIAKDAGTSPWSPYGRHKLEVEQACRSCAQDHGMRITVARLFSVYGPGLRKQLLWDLCGMLARDGRARLGGTGDELRDWVHVDDVTRLLVVAAGQASPEVPVLHGGTGLGTSVRTIAESVAAAHDLAPDAISFSGEVRVGDPFSLVAEPEGGFEWRVGLADGLREYVRWFKRQHAAAS